MFLALHGSHVLNSLYVSVSFGFCRQIFDGNLQLPSYRCTFDNHFNILPTELSRDCGQKRVKYIICDEELW
jgi:hypothetical protein